jgi:excisionase family DNA binding protein
MTLAEALRLPPTLTVEQAGQVLGLGRYAAYDAVKRGDIPVLRFGRRLIVPTPALLGLIGIDVAQGGTDAA